MVLVLAENVYEPAVIRLSGPSAVVQYWGAEAGGPGNGELPLSLPTSDFMVSEGEG